MDEVINTVTSATWWITAVVFGVLINLFSAYIKSPIDRFGSAVSSVWRDRTLRARSTYLKEVEELRLNENLQFHKLLEAIRLRTNANAWLALVVIASVMYSMGLQVVIMKVVADVPLAKDPDVFVWFDRIPFVLGILAFAAATVNATRARLREDLVADARKPRPIVPSP